MAGEQSFEPLVRFLTCKSLNVCDKRERDFSRRLFSDSQVASITRLVRFCFQTLNTYNPSQPYIYMCQNTGDCKFVPMFCNVLVIMATKFSFY